MPVAECLLCRRQAELQHSHVLPAFVYRWLRESSGNGFLRNSKAPNRRIQDGVKRYWLCSECEQRFGSWEKTFADRLFYPYLIESGRRFLYGRWMMQFCVSVSWRVACYCLDEDQLARLDPDSVEPLRAAEEVWRDYLLDRRRRPGEFEQHILPLDEIAGGTISMAPNINRYLMRAVQLDLCHGNGWLFTLAKLGRFMILGFVRVPDRDRWVGTRVHSSYGAIRPRRYEVPAALLGYINEKAASIHKALGEMSERQQERIEAAFRENINKFIGSDAFTAMHADVEMFGGAAFADRGDKGEPA